MTCEQPLKVEKESFESDIEDWYSNYCNPVICFITPTDSY